MTQIFLGYPPEHIKNWIIEHSKPVGNPKTKITFNNGNVEEYDWSGEINQQTMIDAGLFSSVEQYWQKDPYTVEIGTKVTSINNYAFYSCGLKNVTIPVSVTSIGNGAFIGCGRLTSVTIPDSVMSIGDSAFSGCSGLTSVTIPSSVTSIVYDAFSSCSGLTSVIVEGRTTAQARELLANAGLSDINIVTGGIPG